ncbi:CvpA family protein [bacterium]|nr:CvpA family protein [bacterium]
MSIYDIVILAIIAIFAVWGFWRGIIRESFDAAGIIIGVLAARQFAPGIGAGIPPQAIPQFIRTIVISLLILLIVFFLAQISSAIVRKLIRHGPVKPVDRLGGFLIGTLTGSLLVLAIAILIAIIPVQSVIDKATEDAPVFRTTMKLATPLAERYRKALKKSFEKELKRLTENALKAKPDKILKATQGESSLNNAANSEPDIDEPEIENLQISLSNLSPESEQIIKEIIKHYDLPGVDGEQMFDMLKKSGMTLDIPINELNSETKGQLKGFLNDAALKDGRMDKLAGELGVDPVLLSKQLERSN